MNSLSIRYPSTVFLCETNKDDRYIRCDFKHCKDHPLNVDVSKIPVSYWLLNTTKNCDNLERHVTEEIRSFVDQHEREVTQMIPNDYELNFNLVANKDMRQYKKVLMLEKIEKIESLNGINWNPECEILALLSCHSSSQGQVFSCTPTALSKQYGFEEFCSIHDFVCSLQDSLQEKLKIVHISSCFALKLDQSHVDWPVDCSWIKEKLKCLLSGSAKEVYETGSQTADLYLVLKTLTSLVKDDMRTAYTKILKDASLNLFPDLVLEMGLCRLEEDLLQSMIENPEKEDQVTLQNSIVSTLHLMIICDKNDCSAVLLKDALLCNLKTRFELDFMTGFTILENGLEQIGKELENLGNTQVFIVVLTEVNVLNLKKIVETSVEQKGEVTLYGIHFNCVKQNIGDCQKSAAQDVGDCRTYVGDFSESQTFDVEVTGIVLKENYDRLCSETFPIFLYIVHLALGENGQKRNPTTGETTASSWTLSDVYAETCHVLEGLCKICNLKLIYRKSSHVNRSLLESVAHMETSNCNVEVSSTTKTATIDSEVKGVIDQKNESYAGKEEEEKQQQRQQLLQQQQQQQHEIDPGLHGVLDRELKDVPLMANVNEVLIFHYALHLDVDFNEQSICGTEFLFLRPANDEVAQKAFQMCLDCTLIDILSVEEVVLCEDFQIHFHRDQCCCKAPATTHNVNTVEKSDTAADVGNTVKNESECDDDSTFCLSCNFLQRYNANHDSGLNTKGMNYKTLPYAVYGWCIRVWNAETSTTTTSTTTTTPAAAATTTAAHHWPRCVCIRYKTKPVGPSLTWCKDEDGNDCCYTPGAFINNRSMMPCQEPPVAMATWQATINVPKSFMAISSGNLVECKQRHLRNHKQNKDTFCFEMSMPLPSSTLAFVFGKFTRSSRSIDVEFNKQIPVTLFATQSLIQQFEKEYLQLAAEYLQIACQLLGSYPFTRLDLVVMPRSFACMGLESPNMMFLSQSVLCGDRTMSTRIAHEISHAWFGLLVGTKDWTEEWLSEGFATYMEDRILAHHRKMTDADFLNQSGLLQLLRLNVLKGELTQTEDDNLKLLRPNRKNYTTAVEAVNKNAKNDSDYVQPYQTVPNAAIASKKWSQVHYLKGYFLLVHMASTVDFQRFDEFLRKYVECYENQLVNSEMFFDFYATHFLLPSETKTQLINEWLESTGLPKEIVGISARNNVLVQQVEEEFAFWKNCNAVNKRCKSRGIKRKQCTFKTRPKLVNSNQIVLLLEKLLSIEEIVAQTMTQLNICYTFTKTNAEIRHRFCELIIKHGCFSRHDEVKRFLIEDQGMGIYLFGELVIWGRSKQKKLAHELFEHLYDEMDKSTKETVADLVNEQ